MATNHYFNEALLQVMAGGSVYTADWHVSLALNGSDPWETPLATWELAGSRIPLTVGSWIVNPLWEGDAYVGGVCWDTTVDVPCTAAGSVRWWVISNGLAEEKWLFIGQLDRYPVVMAEGDFIRFPAGTLSISINN